MEEILVIDIGGTKTNVSFVTSHNSEIQILSSDFFPTCSNPEFQIQKISSIYSEKSKDLLHLSLSLPGAWDKNGVLRESHNLKSWICYSFINNLKDALNVKNCIFETDVICGALGEYHAQQKISQSLLYINLGTGIGAALIKDGKPFKSDSKLTLRLQKLLTQNENELIPATDLLSGRTILKDTAYNSVEKLYSDYKSGNLEAFEIISKAQLQLASWLINLFYLLGPDLIVLNGGLTFDWDVICEEAIDIANEELNNQIKIVPSQLKELAPVYGAYLNYRFSA